MADTATGRLVRITGRCPLCLRSMELPQAGWPKGVVVPATPGASVVCSCHRTYGTFDRHGRFIKEE